MDLKIAARMVAVLAIGAAMTAAVMTLRGDGQGDGTEEAPAQNLHHPAASLPTSHLAVASSPAAAISACRPPTMPPAARPGPRTAGASSEGASLSDRGQATDIALQPGEQLVGSGPVAAGDTVRWIIGDTESGAGDCKQVHILVKPTRPDLQTNLVINTNARTYHMELRSTEKTYMASVSWQYPHDQLIALRHQNARATEVQPVATGIDISKLNFRYRIEGDTAPWRPLRAFDDGSKVYIEFPSGIGQGDMPPLFVIGSVGDSELMNYRARQNYYVVDRLFAAAELRLGDKNSAKRVRIVRTDGRPTRSAGLFR